MQERVKFGTCNLLRIETCIKMFLPTQEKRLFFFPQISELPINLGKTDLVRQLIGNTWGEKIAPKAPLKFSIVTIVI